MIIKSFKDWENIFLDTSIIIPLILSSRPGVTDKNVLFIRRLVDYLNNNKTSSGVERKFFVSSITISELLDKQNDERTKQIVKAIDSENTNIIPFDNDVADFMTKNYHSILGSKELNKFALALSFPTHDLVMAREWIIRDIMIIGTSHYLQCDALLTSDGATMFKSAQKLGVPSALVFEKYFDFSDTFIMAYLSDKALKENPI